MKKSLVWSEGHKVAWFIRIERMEPSEWIGYLESGQAIIVHFAGRVLTATGLESAIDSESPPERASFDGPEAIQKLRDRIAFHGTQFANINYPGDAGPNYMDDATMLRLLSLGESEIEWAV